MPIGFAKQFFRRRLVASYVPNMTTTARFELQRGRQLRVLFTTERLTKLWRNLVKDQMRNLDIKDLHDYYDFNVAIEARCEGIVEKVLSGQYHADAPLIYRLERSLGICRHLMIPSPSDALVFQLLTEVLYKGITKAQPSQGAYYARDRHTLSLPHERRDAAVYPWFILWPQFQKKIWKFSKSHKYLVTTDLSNYFDNIGLRELRHVISSIIRTKEVYLDLLFSLIENLSWKPDYLPTSLKGLPTINIEAPRLLAHALLFEIDDVLKRRTKNSFVRWMDDINFGVDDLKTANEILGQVNDVLKSRGLALNLSKTAVLSPKQAERHFLFQENIRLNKLQRVAENLKSDHRKQRFAKKIARELSEHLKNCKARNKDKLTKRFLTILSKLRVPVALEEVVEVFKKYPGLRKAALRYLSALTFSSRSAKAFVRVIRETEAYDDVTLFNIVESAVYWAVPYNKRGKAFVANVFNYIKRPTSGFQWFCLIYFLAKYGEPHEVLTATTQLKGISAREPFLARQKVAVLPRSLGINANRVRRLWGDELSTGPSDAASVASNLIRVLDGKFPTRNNRTYWYLFPNKRQRPYPVAKFLLLCVIAYADVQNRIEMKRPKVMEHVTDPWYRHWLRKINPAWF